MRFNKVKWVTLAIAYCFAVLQVLQPFIHAHLDAEHPIQELGFHIGSEHEELTDFSGDFASHVVSNADHTSHTVLVASGIKQDFNPVLASDVLCVLLAYICFAVALRCTSKRYSSLSFIPCSSSRRRLPAPRAPPRF